MERGDRVRLVHCDDPYTKLVPGDTGTVNMEGADGTVYVKWDSGSTLSMIPEEGDLIEMVV
jgi:hypothetical protein